MYEAYYGFSAKPFQLNPDPTFYFDSRQHRRAMSFLEYGLHKNEGFIVVTGEIGAGKTTLVRNLLAKLDPEKVVAINLVSTQLDAEDTLRMVAATFGIRTKDIDKSQLLLTLEAFLTANARDGKRCLLIVDEAQNLTARAVEELRMLSNFQLGTQAILQSFLIGQPEFREMLESTAMQQLRQRVIAACHIGSMDLLETQGYIEHRLKCVGWKDSPHFQEDAFMAIFAASGGVPRRINSICDRLLLSGFLEDKRVFSRENVEEIANEFQNETLVPKVLSKRKSDTSGPWRNPEKSDSNQRTNDWDGPEFNDHNVMHIDGLVRSVQRIEQGLIRLETTLIRLEKSNTATLTQFRSLLEWARSREMERDENT